MDRSRSTKFLGAFTPSGTFFECLGSGPPVVFLHGLGCDLTMWAGLSRLSTYRSVLTYDLAGHGRTRLQTPLSVEGYVDQLTDLLLRNEVSDCVLVGFSLGGVVAASMAAAHPEKVRGLVLSNVPFRRTEAELQRARDRIQHIEVEGIQRSAPSFVHRWFPGVFLKHREELEARLLDMLFRNRDEDFLRAYALALSGDSILEDVSENIRCPSVVLGGSEDTSVQEESIASLGAKLRSRRSVTFEGAGHMLPVQCCVRFISEIERFLNEQTGPDLS
jgi:3-oxoadipate enol-lactonase